MAIPKFVVPADENIHSQSLLVTASKDKTSRIWGVNSGECLYTLKVDNKEITPILYVPPKESIIGVPLMLAQLPDKTTQIWNLNTGECLQTFTSEKATIVSNLLVPSRDNIYKAPLILAQDDQFWCRLWNLSNLIKRPNALYGHESSVTEILFIPKNENCFNSPLLITAGEDRLVKIWDLNTYKCLFTLRSHNEIIISIVFIPASGNFMKEPLLLSASWDFTVKIWKINTGTLVTTLEGHRDEINSFITIPAEENRHKSLLIATASRDKTVKFWNSENGECIFTLEEEFELRDLYYIAPKFNKFNAALLAISTGETIFTILNINTFTKTHTLVHSENIGKTLFIPAENEFQNSLIVSNCGEIVIWDCNLGDCINTFGGSKGDVMSLLYIPSNENVFNERLLVTVSSDEIAKVWKVDSGECIHSIEGYNLYQCKLYIPPSENFVNSPLIVVLSTVKSAIVFNVNTGDCIHTFEGDDPYLYSAYIPANINSLNVLLIVLSSRDSNVYMYEFTPDLIIPSFKSDSGVSSKSPVNFHNDQIAGFFKTGRDYHLYDAEKPGTVEIKKFGFEISFMEKLRINNKDYLLVASKDVGVINICDFNTFDVVKNFELKTNKSQVTSAIVRNYPKGEFLILGTQQGTVIMFNYNKETLHVKIENQHLNPVTCLDGFTFGLDNYVISADKDGVVKFFDFSGACKFEPDSEDSILSRIVTTTYLNRDYLIGVYQDAVKLWTLSYNHLKKNSDRGYRYYMFHQLNK